MLFQPALVRFEAGSTSIADAVGLGAALDYVQRIERENIARHEHDLLAYATARLLEVPGLTPIGTAPDKAAVLSFVLDGLTPEEVGEALDRDGIAVRAPLLPADRPPVRTRGNGLGVARAHVRGHRRADRIAPEDRRAQRRAAGRHGVRSALSSVQSSR